MRFVAIRRLAIVGGFCLLAAGPALAQGGTVPLQTLPYPVTVAVPENGCAWSGMAYSDGAVIRPLPTAFSYFRCARGSWQRFSSLAAATAEPAPEAEGSSRPPP